MGKSTVWIRKVYYMSITTLFLSLSLWNILTSLSSAEGKVYYIKPSKNSVCPQKPCLMLSQFAGRSRIFSGSNVSLFILPGNHSLNLPLNISGVNILSVHSNSASLQKVLCKGTGSMVLSTINYVYISYIKFQRCQKHHFHSVNLLMIEHNVFLNHRGSALEILSSNIKITNTSFISNTGGSRQLCSLPRDSSYRQSGGAIVAKQSSIFLSDSMFDENYAEVGGAIFVDLHSKIVIVNTVFQRNRSDRAGGAVYSIDSYVSVYNCSFYSNAMTGDSYLEQYGGVLGLFDSKFSAELCIFEENRPHHYYSKSYRYYYGGVVYANNALLTVIASKFTSNGNVVIGGAISAVCSAIFTTETSFTNNSAKGGGAIDLNEGNITINETTFKSNYFNAIRCAKANITITRSNFEENGDGGLGGAIYIEGNPRSRVNYIAVFETNFSKNYATLKGGALHLAFSAVKIENSLFIYNSVIGSDELFFHGGAVFIEACNHVKITNTMFIGNKAKHGGALCIETNKNVLQFNNNTFTENDAEYGGALSAVDHNNIMMNENTIENNVANVAIIYARNGNIIHVHNTVMKNNTADLGIIYLFQSTGFLSDIILANNKGSVIAYFSNVTLSRRVSISNCSTFIKNSTVEEGGAISAYRSILSFDGTCSLFSNHATNGGGIHATGSKLYVASIMNVTSNTASSSGGGIYLYQSELNCQSQCTLTLVNNTSIEGGGIHAISSSLIAQNGQDKITFRNNTAVRAGGGISLEVNAKIYILMSIDSNPRIYTISFVANSANCGGGIYIADSTNSGTCASESYDVHSTTTECFIQALSLQHSDYQNNVVARFTENYAHTSGSNLFGGLLDRCTVSPLTVRNYFNPTYKNSVMYFKQISAIKELNSISSGPVKICFCNLHGEPDCSYRPPPVQAMKGHTFTLSLVAVDQVNNTVPNVTVRSYLSSSLGGLGENQLNQNTGEDCTLLNFSIYTRRSSEELILYADGPCKDVHASQSRVGINFSLCKCPIGFQPNVRLSSKCECECNSALLPLLSTCDPVTETILREGVYWIDYIIEDSGYLIHPHCPYDYCKPADVKVEINLNIKNGADVQCANKRSGILCGTCSLGYSLSLGSSNCILCQIYWSIMTVILVTVFIMGGLILVSIILMLNLTVAVGTLNGIIFYANIVAANTNTVFPSNVFIYWLNLELGFDTCFYDGMNIYWKTWLQFAFPTYIIFLVVMVIAISERSPRFARLIGRKDPVAALATLVLFSYTKLLQTIIASLSGTVLKYPGINHTHDEVVWLPDASIKYLSGKHIPLFIVAVVILLVGTMYTVILFLWQWLLGLKLCQWVNNTQRLSLFIQTYHTPYTSKHRYWTGLLLIARIVLYVVSATNVEGDPKINLTAIGVIVTSTLLLKEFVEFRYRIYHSWFIETLESVCYINLAFLCIMFFFTLDNSTGMTIILHISVSLTIALLLVVLLYHIFNEVISKMELWRNYKERQQRPFCGITTMAENNHPTPTYSIIEGPKQSSLKPRKKGGKALKSSFDGELKEILLDENEQYT